MTTVVDSGDVVVAGATVEFRNTLQKDGATYNLTGKTVVATIRRRRNAGTSLGSAYEDIAVTLGNVDTTAANGGVYFTKELAVVDFATPLDPEAYEEYEVQYHVTTDDYYPYLLRFGVRRGLD